ncbi:NrsF family protein [Xanthobacter sp. AM11]|uniref:NrsF family protein n=1 Tax=Xanthobacter sp. AM11 TaxID=3380643 RepID=UPI0039BF5724
MKTEDLIRGLAADMRPGRSLEGGLALGVLAGVGAAALLFALILAPRPGLLPLLAEWRIVLKFAVTLPLAAASLMLALRLSRPAADAGRWALLLLLPVAVLVAGVVAELAATPPATWRSDLIGRYAPYCVSLIPLLAAPVLGALLLALRRGAATRPAVAGAAAGLAAGGLAAAIYALHCVDDSPLFMLAWYSLAVVIVTAAGAVLGRRILAW